MLKERSWNLVSRKPKLYLAVRTLLALLTTSICFLAPAAADRGPETPGPQYRLKLFHTHTGERLDIVYRRGDQYLPDALQRLDYFLRDHRTGDVRHYDPRVFDLLQDLRARVSGPDSEVDVICGYRTPWSNEFLRKQGHGVARNSLHMQAMAIDIRIPGVTISTLRDAALALHRGGVGYYADSRIVHVDVGPVRRW